MKLFVVLCMAAAVVAEPPRFRPARFREVRFQRQELAPSTTDAPSTTAAPDDAPYPAAGWKPAGAPFTLPNEQQNEPEATYGPPAPYPAAGWKPAQPFQLPNEQSPPATSYGVPDNTYGIPDNSYGAPTTDAANATESITTTDKPQAEKLEGPVDVQKSEGTYYVLLPNGQLQKVTVESENDVQNMRYTARLQLGERAPLLLFRP